MFWDNLRKVLDIGVARCNAGDVGDVLRVLSQLPQLIKLDFFNQFLTGTLPADVSFPRLVEIRLIANDISVRPHAHC